MSNVIADRHQATVLIVTKNRRDELRRAVASALAQTPQPAEILVVDDGSTDGTTEMIQSEFPSVRVHRRENSAGYIVGRNDGVRLASNPLVVVVDDDITFSTPYTVAQTLVEFDEPRVGAVSIPFIHHNATGDILSDRAPDSDHVYVTAAYIGAAHAVRRDVFLKLGGYRGCLFHYGEERDYCTRLPDAGYVVRLGKADLIDHWVSSKRETSRQYIYGPRNHILYPWHNVPMPYLPLHWAATLFNTMKMGIRSGHPWWVLRGILAGHWAILHELFKRAPISCASYRLLRFLGKRRFVTLAEIETRLESAVRPARRS